MERFSKSAFEEKANELIEREIAKVTGEALGRVLESFNNRFKEVVEEKKVTPKPRNPRKLNKRIAKAIYILAHTTDMTHKDITKRVKETYGVEIVPHTVSDIKLGKRWKGVSKI